MRQDHEQSVTRVSVAHIVLLRRVLTANAIARNGSPKRTYGERQRYFAGDRRISTIAGRPSCPLWTWSKQALGTFNGEKHSDTHKRWRSTARGVCNLLDKTVPRDVALQVSDFPPNWQNLELDRIRFPERPALLVRDAKAARSFFWSTDTLPFLFVIHRRRELCKRPIPTNIRHYHDEGQRHPSDTLLLRMPSR